MEDARWAQECADAGADQIELCRELDHDGLTPRAAEVARAASAGLPVMAMIRSQPGPFHTNSDEVVSMQQDMKELLAAGAHGFVLGFCERTDPPSLDSDALKAMVDAAEGRPLTFHRAFDGFTNPLETADTLADLGFHSILTAGGHGGAADNHPALADLVTKTQGNIQIIVGGGVRATNIAELHRQTQATMFHSSLDRKPTVEAVDQLLQSLHENS